MLRLVLQLLLLVLSTRERTAFAAHMEPPAPPHRVCTLDTECAAVHRGVCMAATADGAGRGVCACAPGRGWHTMLRACVTYETGTAVSLDANNATLGYGPTGTGNARFAPDLRWPGDWTCDALQCRATERGVSYATWRRDVIVAAATDAGAALANYTLAPAEVWVRCAPATSAADVGAGATAFLRTAAADASDPAQAAVAAWRHCASCAQWCGAHGACDLVASAALAARSDPAQAAFVCACATGWTGARCDIALASGTGAAGATGASQAPVVPLGAGAGVSDLAYLAARAFPAYSLTRACVADSDCAGGASERCYIHVPESRARARLTRYCFCAPGMVPTHGAATSCVAAASQTVALWGSAPATATAGLAPPALVATTGGTLSAAQAAAAAALGSAQLTTVWANGSATQAGVLVAAQTAAGDALVAPLLLAAAGVDNVTAAYARANPYLVACAAGAGGGFYVPDASAVQPTPAAAWCTTCAQVCGTAAVCDPEASAAGTEAADTGTCVCDPLHTGPACTACANATVPPACAQTWTQCAAARCSAHGHCYVVDSGAGGVASVADAQVACACDPGWAGPACAEAAAPCRAANCTAHGACTATPGVCACDPGWTGADCSISATECRRALCTTHGACTTDMRCACDAGWAGPDCAQRWCGTHGGVSVASAIAGAAPTCDCAAAGGWVGDTCETDLCGVTVGLGAWSDAVGGCVCEGVYTLNTDAPAALPRCTAHRCGQYGYPVAVDFCVCNNSYAVEFDPTRMRHDSSVLCVPVPPVTVSAVTWRATYGTGAVYTYSERPAVFAAVVLATAFAMGLGALVALLRATPSGGGGGGGAIAAQWRRLTMSREPAPAAGSNEQTALLRSAAPTPSLRPSALLGRAMRPAAIPIRCAVQ